MNKHYSGIYSNFITQFEETICAQSNSKSNEWMNYVLYTRNASNQLLNRRVHQLEYYYSSVLQKTCGGSGLILLWSMWSNNFMSGAMHSWVLSSSCSNCSSVTKYDDSWKTTSGKKKWRFMYIHALLSKMLACSLSISLSFLLKCTSEWEEGDLFRNRVPLDHQQEKVSSQPG